MSEYPEHDKMAAVRTELDAVGEFLEALGSGELTSDGRRLHLAVENAEARGRVVIVGADIPDLLSQYFEIDQNQIEVEKRQMLDSIRAEG